ncbi:type II secretion system F family protein [Pseudarthrobacter sp. 1C304]|uniref:type II secretion system F family protein n=1 Tax=Pseudarthrobacter sp. 1C304 TaxID=3457438 RepID=UPI003FD3DF1C
MTALMVGVLALAALLALSPAGARRRRFGGALAAGTGAPGAGPQAQSGRAARWRRKGPPGVPMNLLVQQLAALLKGGRTPGRLWDELWLLHGGEPVAPPSGAAMPGRTATLAPGSVRLLAAARAAAMRGSPVGAAIRSAAASGRLAGTADAGAGAREGRVWLQLAACFDVAEATGCPLAEVLTRFAAQLEAEDDAEAARQTALAGPRATVRLLTWLPFLGLGLGMLLGVDGVNVLLGTSWGGAALVAGLALTAAGRIWSARLVRAAEGLQQ